MSGIFPKVWFWFFAVLAAWLLIVSSPVVMAQEEREPALSERQQERITNLAANISNRMDATVVRLKQINQRVASRADKVEGFEEVMANVKTNTAQVNSILGQTEGILSEMDNHITAVVGSQEPRERWWQVRTYYLDAKDNLREAHELLGLSVLMLKEPATYSVNIPETATTSPTAATTTSSTTDSTTNPDQL